MSERATHLLSWLEQGYTHCQYGSQEWCEGYLHNAKAVIEEQDVTIAKLTARISKAEADLAFHSREDRIFRDYIGRDDHL